MQTTTTTKQWRGMTIGIQVLLSLECPLLKVTLDGKPTDVRGWQGARTGEWFLERSDSKGVRHTVHNSDMAQAAFELFERTW